jgi:hypothetical protein
VPESTLTLSTADLQAAIGHFLGYGRGASFGETAWTTEQQNNITDLMKSGLSQVYTPPPINQNEPPYSWSFLRPDAKITIPSGSYTVPLPDSFGGFEGPSLSLFDPQAQGRVWPLPIRNEGEVQQQIASWPATSGSPRMAAESVQDGTGPNRSTRSNLIVWPKPDKSYVIGGEWKHLPDALTGAFPYPPGGSEHSEMFKASVLAAAELYLDDTRGPRWTYFMERLAASVHADRKHKGQKLGYNGDWSDREPGRQYVWHYGATITYNGNPL